MTSQVIKILQKNDFSNEDSQLKKLCLLWHVNARVKLNGEVKVCHFFISEGL